MNNGRANSQKNVLGFWARLMLAVEAMGESHEERIEGRVRRLEAEVERLAAMQKQFAKA